MNAKKIINEKLTLIDENISSKEEAISKLVQICYSNELITDKTNFFNRVIQREDEISTAIGYEIAMPHGKSRVVKEPFVAFLRASHNFKWNKNDQDTVKLVFLIGINNENSNIHLKFISNLSKKLLDETFRDNLINATNTEEVLDIIKQIEI